MKTVAILAALGVVALTIFSLSPTVDSSAESQFKDFLSIYRAGYATTDEYSFRLGVFAQNLETIDELNRLNPDAFFGVNEFADRTPEEMKKRMGLNMPEGRLTGAAHIAPVNAADVDWTDMWTSVKNQGQCGSCWAFSATAAFEARYELAHGTKKAEVSYSEQELVDCEPQSDGCKGGLMDFAFEYLQKKSFCTTAQYPYTAKDESCKDTKCDGGPTDEAFTDIPEGDEDSLVAELQNGPVAVAVDAASWSFYFGGIMSHCGKSLDHGVTLVAVNSDKGYLKIRNSWGGSWGEKGHIRVKLGKNTCGIANSASVPTF